MKDKYIEADYPIYFIFGEHENGMVDVASAKNDTVATVSRNQANTLIDDRNSLVQKLCDMARAFEAADNSAFTKFWYGT